jgi:hypothetical protein
MDYNSVCSRHFQMISFTLSLLYQRVISFLGCSTI